MLFLITGQPGNGKTLFTLGLVEENRQSEKSVELGRKVYQHGIPDLTLPWEALDDPAAWHEKPNGSIVVIDECQRVFPPRKQGAAVPKHVSEFETHRHRGFDVYLITQHPQLLDIAVRKLVGRHYHLERRFGQDAATVYQFEQCENPQDRSSRSKALTSTFKFPRERFAWYKSADMHHVKKDLPWKKIALVIGSLVAVVLLFSYAFMRLAAPAQERITENLEGVTNPELEQRAGERSRSWTPDDLTPRLATWPWSAPFYDRVVKIVAAPRITGCMLMVVGEKRQCTCSNGQGVADVPANVCHDYMAGRYFDPTKPVEDVKAENIKRLDAGSAAAQSPTDAQEPGSRVNASSG